jgi:tRNA modification GTPase
VNEEDTIAAVASPPGGALRSIVRISGPGVAGCLRACLRPDAHRWAQWTLAGPPRVIPSRLRLGLPLGDVPCDVYYWPGPRSFTRQAVAEIHLLGSPPLVDAAMRAVCAAGARLAQPGEFTLRAFLAGRIDLTQAEAVLGIIDARDRSQLDSALQQLAGGLARPLDRLRESLLDLLADLEAGLDFVDEDIQFLDAAELQTRLADAAQQIQALETQVVGRSERDEEFRIALVGWPNVGKSSLWNALVGEPAAIVADSAGTTRDYLTRRVAIGGLDCLLIDTAGIAAHGADGIEAQAQRLGAQQAAQADLQVWCIDGTRPLNSQEQAAMTAAGGSRVLCVLTKTDQPTVIDGHQEAIRTSSRTGAGLEELKEAMAASLLADSDTESRVVIGTLLRCRESLRTAAASLQQACQLAVAGTGEEIVAAEIRRALDQLGQVVGAVYTDDILDRVFSRFCLGK